MRDRGQHGLLGDDDPDADREHDAAVPEGEEVAERERAGLAGAQALAQHLAGGVVDRGDVVGVERVPQAQGVGGDRKPDPEELVVGGQHVHDEQREPDRVHRQDGPVHPGDPHPLGPGHRGEGLPEHRPHAGGGRRCNTLRRHGLTPRSLARQLPHADRQPSCKSVAGTIGVQQNARSRVTLTTASAAAPGVK